MLLYFIVVLLYCLFVLFEGVACSTAEAVIHQRVGARGSDANAADAYLLAAISSTVTQS